MLFIIQQKQEFVWQITKESLELQEHQCLYLVMFLIQ